MLTGGCQIQIEYLAFIHIQIVSLILLVFMYHYSMVLSGGEVVWLSNL